jgi:hypothetical protein
MENKNSTAYNSNTKKDVYIEIIHLIEQSSNITEKRPTDPTILHNHLALIFLQRFGLKLEEKNIEDIAVKVRNEYDQTKIKHQDTKP